jgi:hypothetical protein
METVHHPQLPAPGLHGRTDSHARAGFFRGFAFAWFERLVLHADSSELARAQTHLEACRPKLIEGGFMELAFEDCMTVFQNQVN